MRPWRKYALLGAGILALAVVGELFIPHAHAAANQYAVFQPMDAEDQWRLGQSLRICATEAPTGAGTLTPPSGPASSPTADSEGCFTVTPDQEGTWTLSWPVAGPATRTVSFQAWGAETTDWASWLTLLGLFGLFLLCWFEGWYFSTFWVAAGLGAHVLDLADSILTFQETVMLALLGILLELVVRMWQRKKPAKET